MAAKLMLKDLAVGPPVFDFTNSAFESNPSGGAVPIRLVASIVVLPSTPLTLSSASAIDPPGMASTTASACETSPPSRPIRVSSCPALLPQVGEAAAYVTPAYDGNLHLGPP